MSATPRTDEAWAKRFDYHDISPWSLCMKLEIELAEAQNILKQCLSIMPFGYVPTHTVENLPEKISDLAKALAAETTEREQLEPELAEALEQRDTLAEALRNAEPHMRHKLNCNARLTDGELGCTCGMIKDRVAAISALAAVKGGGK